MSRRPMWRSMSSRLCLRPETSRRRIPEAPRRSAWRSRSRRRTSTCRMRRFPTILVRRRMPDRDHVLPRCGGHCRADVPDGVLCLGQHRVEGCRERPVIVVVDGLEAATSANSGEVRLGEGRPTPIDPEERGNGDGEQDAQDEHHHRQLDEGEAGIGPPGSPTVSPEAPLRAAANKTRWRSSLPLPDFV